MNLSVWDILLTSIAIFVCCCCSFGGISLQIHKRKQILMVQSKSTREREYSIEPGVGSGSTENVSKDSEIVNILAADIVSDDAFDANETINGGDHMSIGGNNALLFEQVTLGDVEAAFTDTSSDEMDGYQETNITSKGCVDDNVNTDDDGTAGETNKSRGRAHVVSDDDGCEPKTID